MIRVRCMKDSKTTCFFSIFVKAIDMISSWSQSSWHLYCKSSAYKRFKHAVFLWIFMHEIYVIGSLKCTTDTGEIGLKITSTAKISNNFSWESPYIPNTFSRESSNCHTSFHGCKRSPHHPKDLTIKSLDLEIQIFSVWSPPWVVG